MKSVIQHMQSLFDKSAFHLLTQGKPSMAVSGGSEQCKYRGPKGTSCAIGCLIPDELYSPKFETKGWSSFTPFGTLYGTKASRGRRVYELLNPDDSLEVNFFLERLQEVHDGDPVHEWPDRLRDVAKEYNLKTSIIELAEVLTKEYEL